MNAKMKFRILALVCFSLLFTIMVGFWPVASSATDHEINEDREALIIRGVLSALQQLHYEPLEINDEVSKKAFKSYMEKLDSGKRFFTEDEYQYLKDWEFKIDDQILEERFEFFNQSLEIINDAVVRAKSIYPKLLANPFDYQTKEFIEFDGKKLSYAKGEEELIARWRQVLQYEAMTKIIEKEEEQEKNDSIEIKRSFDELEIEAREDVLKSMNNWFDRLSQLRRGDRFSDYVNAITETFDPHTNYYSPKDKEDFNIGMSGRLEGIGARLQSDGEFTKVESVVPGGPAWKQKELEVNDQIIKVKQEEGEPLDIRGMRLDDVVKHIRGKKGTKVILTIKKPDGSSKDITITRDEVILDEGFAKSAILKHSEIIDNIGYIRLPKFYADFERENGSSCSKDVAAEIEKLKKLNVKGIILDLRNNGGGSLRDVVDMSGLFIEQGPIVQVKSRNQKPQILGDQDPTVQYNGPLIVMVNTFSASASEILAAALQDYNRALIVGSPSTFGKGTVQRFYDLDKLVRSHSELKPFGEIKLTMQKFYRINGGSTQLKGVVPDVVLPDNYMFFELGEKEYEHSMAWSEIEPLNFQQNSFLIADKKSIVNASKSRISQDTLFQLIQTNAERVKKQRDDRLYPLHLESYKTWLKEREENSKRFEDLFENDIPDLFADNLEVDMEYIQMDESRIVRNDTWLEGLRKDIYLKETLSLMKDMIDGSATAKLTNKE